MAGDPRALLRQVGRPLPTQPQSKQLISGCYNRQNSLYKKRQEALASSVDDKTNVQVDADTSTTCPTNARDR